MASTVKMIVALMCLGILIIECAAKLQSCCAKCRINRRESYQKALYRRTSYLERYSYKCGSWWNRRTCWGYRCSWKNVCIGYTRDFRTTWTCRAGCSCPPRWEPNDPIHNKGDRHPV